MASFFYLTDNPCTMGGDTVGTGYVRTCTETENPSMDGDAMEAAQAAVTDQDFGEQLRALTQLRAQPVIQYGELRLLAQNGMLCIRRIWKAEELRLYINRTDDSVNLRPLLSKMEKKTASEDMPAQKTGLVMAKRKVKILAENQYCVGDGLLNSEGYLICMI